MSKQELEDTNDAFKPRRQRLHIDIDSVVQRNDGVYRIVQVLDFHAVIGVDLFTGRTEHLRIGELRSVESDVVDQMDLEVIADEDWKVAAKRFAAISPLADRLTIGREDAEERAKECGINVATLYRWLKKYNSTGTVVSLIPVKRGWKSGNRRIPVEIENVIAEVIENFYLTEERPSPQDSVTEVHRICSLRGLELPSHTTVRARISEIPEREMLRGRGYREQAINKFSPSPGKFPNADYPLAVIQIDHTPADIILVDDIHRLPIGRPWITLAIDVNTRVVVGLYISFDPPSETSVAMCIASSILPKDEWLMSLGVDAEWPVWGTPKTIHVDNGADFRSDNVRRSCLAYAINLEFRPVRNPRYGGHIERLLGTFSKEIHSLPGTTFSSVKDRDGYDSEKHAALTRSEFELWLTTLICKVYHQKIHSRIGMTPLRKWDLGIFGDGVEYGVGVPARPVDRLTVLLDFLPTFYRTIQTFGVTVDDIPYYAESLRPWINFKDKESGKNTKFIFKRDPRDISVLWFYDPDLKQYFKIPFADQALPSMSSWELKQVKERLKREGRESFNQHEVLRAITELRDQVEVAKKNTKKARRQSQRRKEHEKKDSQIVPQETKSPEPSMLNKAIVDADEELLDGDIDSYGDIA